MSSYRAIRCGWSPNTSPRCSATGAVRLSMPILGIGAGTTGPITGPAVSGFRSEAGVGVSVGTTGTIRGTTPGIIRGTIPGGVPAGGQATATVIGTAVPIRRTSYAGLRPIARLRAAAGSDRVRAVRRRSTAIPAGSKRVCAAEPPPQTAIRVRRSTGVLPPAAIAAVPLETTGADRPPSTGAAVPRSSATIRAVRRPSTGAAVPRSTEEIRAVRRSIAAAVPVLTVGVARAEVLRAVAADEMPAVANWKREDPLSKCGQRKQDVGNKIIDKSL